MSTKTETVDIHSTLTSRTKPADIEEEVAMHLSKASGIVHVISRGLLDGKARFDETLFQDIKTALWSAYDHIDEARELLGGD